MLNISPLIDSDGKSCGVVVDLEKVLQYLLARKVLCKEVEAGETIQLKISLDGRPFCGRDQVLVGVVCTNGGGLHQSSLEVLPVAIIHQKETKHMYSTCLSAIREQVLQLSAGGATYDERHYPVQFISKYIHNTFAHFADYCSVCGL